MENSKKAFLIDFAVLQKKYPDVRHQPNRDNWYRIVGELPIFDEDNFFRAVFSVELLFTKYYPLGFGTLKETGGKIPCKIDWHKYDDETCCICATPEEIIQMGKKNSILDFTEEYALPFLVNYLHKKEYGYYPNGEYAHGDMGTIQWYCEQFPNSLYSTIADKLQHIKIIKFLPKIKRCVCNKVHVSRKKDCLCANIYDIPNSLLNHHIEILLKRQLRTVSISYTPIAKVSI